LTTGQGNLWLQIHGNGYPVLNRCLYEKLDPSNYESGARMVAFRTFHERIVPWIKILNLYYYELMGKHLKTYLTRLISVENTIFLSQFSEHVFIPEPETYKTGQFYWYWKPEDLEKTTDMLQVTDKL
jgi:hypothetical protein